MNAVPCVISQDLTNYQRQVDSDADYQARIETKAAELRNQYRADADVLWESLGNVTARKDSSEVSAIVKVLRDGGTLHELAAAMHGLRELVLAEADETAEVRAEGEVQKEDARAERHRALRNFHGGDEL